MAATGLFCVVNHRRTESCDVGQKTMPFLGSSGRVSRPELPQEPASKLEPIETSRKPPVIVGLDLSAILTICLIRGAWS